MTSPTSFQHPNRYTMGNLSENIQSWMREVAVRRKLLQADKKCQCPNGAAGRVLSVWSLDLHFNTLTITLWGTSQKPSRDERGKWMIEGSSDNQQLDQKIHTNRSGRCHRQDWHKANPSKSGSCQRYCLGLGCCHKVHPSSVSADSRMTADKTRCKQWQQTYHIYVPV